MRYIFIFLILIIIIFQSWLSFNYTLSSGDWPYLYKENIKEFKIFEPPFLWVDPYYRLTAKIGTQILNLPWEVTEKLFWFLPFILITSISSFLFVKYIISLFVEQRYRTLFSIIGAVIYTTNTYILMIVGGGQMGVAMAYGLAPLVLKYLFEISKSPKTSSLIKRKLIGGVLLSIQLMFDPRVFILTILLIIFFRLCEFIITKEINRKVILNSLYVLGIAVILNLFWIIPNLIFFGGKYNEAVGALEIKFLSFASFSNSLSLLHPNWPENMFGKLYFMRPEFTVLPLIEFGSLLFVNSKVKGQKLKAQLKSQNSKSSQTILFFCFLALLGAFLAKGTNPPFGEIYLWLSMIPGFKLFRDPTKFYLLVVLSYTILIPLTLSFFSNKLSRVLGAKSVYIVLFTFLLFWLFSIRPAVLGQLSGTFKPRQVPAEYIKFKDFIKKQNQDFSILWVPRHQRFGFQSKLHFAIDAQDLLGTLDSKNLIRELKKKNIRSTLKEENVGYVVLPYDSEKELFLKGYTFDPALRANLEKTLNALPWLEKVQGFELLDIYKVKY